MQFTEAQRKYPATPAAELHLSQIGATALKQREGLRLTPYQDAGGTWTVGYGHATNVHPTDKITEQTADWLFARDVKIAETAITHAKPISLTQYEFDALVSFAYNVGYTKYQRSDIARAAASGNINSIPAALLGWAKVNGEHNSGLFARRKAEAWQFQGAGY